MVPGAAAEPIPIRNALGYGELFWSIRHWFNRLRSTHWPLTLGTVEGYEFLMASQNGWLVVFYSYQFEGRSFSGEWRKWHLFTFSSIESQTEKVRASFPIGAKVAVRIDPNSPNRSIAEL
jgi:hypothetical protein